MPRRPTPRSKPRSNERGGKWRRRMDKIVDRFALVVLLGCALAVAGCSAGAHFHFAPAGAGLAATAEGPGAEGSLTDKNGVTVVSGSISVNPLALLSDA